MNRNVLVLIGVFSLCGASFTGLSWWTGLSDVQRAQLFGQSLACWFCCGGPLVGGLAGWFLNNWRRSGWHIARPPTHLKVEDL